MAAAPTDATVATMAIDRRTDATRGDWIEVPSPGGGPVQRGQILDVLGRPDHYRLRVRWDDDRVTIHYPSSRDRVIPREQALSGP